jgi:hypothetical protein
VYSRPVFITVVVVIVFVVVFALYSLCLVCPIVCSFVCCVSFERGVLFCVVSYCSTTATR